MFKVLVDYPTKDQEQKILKRMARSKGEIEVSPILQPSDILRLRDLADGVYLDEKLETYIVDLVEATRNPADYGMQIGPLIRYGASPRATIFLAMASRAHAMIQARGYVTPQDVKSVAKDVLRHRVILTYEAEAEEKTSEDIINEILASVDVP